MTYRSLVISSERPDVIRRAQQLRAELKAHSDPSWTPPNEDLVNPCFAPSWRACWCAIEHNALIGKEKVKRAANISVTADTTTVMDCNGDALPDIFAAGGTGANSAHQTANAHREGVCNIRAHKLNSVF